jgi:long-chain acyl-CoA synthetase
MEMPWLKNYPTGVPVKINPDQYQSLAHFVEKNLAKFKDNTAFQFMGIELTYGQIDQKSTDFAAYLQSRGLKKGDRIILMMPNMLQYPIALFGAIKAGLIVVNTNPLYTPREMRHQFSDSGAIAIVIAENFAANLQEILKDTKINTIILTSIGEMLGFKGMIVNFVVRHIKRLVPAYQLSNTVNFNTALKHGQQFTLNKPDISLDDVVALQYTGGTTGVSKGAMLTNRNLVANMLQIRAWLGPNLEENGEVVLCALPLYHIFAFTVNCLAMLDIGAKNLLIVNARDLPAMIKEMTKTPCTVMTGINTLYNAMMNHPDFATLPTKQLKICVAGGMALQKAVAERWQQKTGCYVTEGFGMTESSPVASVNPLGNKLRLGTIGMPVPSTELKIVNDEGKDLPVNEVGEILIKGPQVMKGYWNRQDETDKCLKDGWLYTGDIGFMHPDGFFQIVDRKKDMILVSGFNVYPNEIEDLVMTHPKVLECAAVGIPDEKSGEVPKLFVVKKDQSLTSEELIEYCKTGLTNYKIPRQVEFRTELPKTNVGKILRRMLRDESKPT